MPLFVVIKVSFRVHSNEQQMERPYYIFLGSTTSGMESGILPQATFKLEPDPESGLLYLGVQFIIPKKHLRSFHTPVPPASYYEKVHNYRQTHMDRLNDQTT